MIAGVATVPDEALVCDVVIVGSGVIGCAIARELLLSGLRVLVLESGSDRPSDASDETIAGVETGRSFPGLTAGRRRGYGGTGARWAGQCAPLDAIDMEDRPWIDGGHWPMTRPDLENGYQRAAAFLGIANEPFDDRQWHRHSITPAGLHRLDHKFSVFSPHPDVGRRYRREFERSRSVEVLTDATVTEIRLVDAADAVAGVTVRGKDGIARGVTSPIVVLAAGGIENARLLLASRNRQTNGIGNRHGLVGKHLHDHPNCIAAIVETMDARRFQDLYALSYHRRVKAWARIPLPADRQRSDHLLNATASVLLDHGTGSPVGRLKEAVRGARGASSNAARLRAVGAVAGLLPAASEVAWRRYVRGRSPAQAPQRILLQLTAEQPPLGPSQVRLSDQQDRFGVPLAEVSWVIGEPEMRAQVALMELISARWGRAGIAEVRPLPHMRDLAAWTAEQSDAYHHSGTTRMARNAKEGVVDPASQVHGVRGLYVAGTSVLPTSSHSNPTFPALALAMGLSDRLRKSR